MSRQTLSQSPVNVSASVAEKLDGINLGEASLPQGYRERYLAGSKEPPDIAAEVVRGLRDFSSTRGGMMTPEQGKALTEVMNRNDVVEQLQYNIQKIPFGAEGADAATSKLYEDMLKETSKMSESMNRLFESFDGNKEVQREILKLKDRLEEAIKPMADRQRPPIIT